MESYKQIKSDLDVLRQSVEKSELWVYKSNKPVATTNDGDEHQQVQAQTSTAQVVTTANNDTPVTMTSSTHSGDTASSITLPSQKEETDHSATSIPPTISGSKEHAETTKMYIDGEEEEDEDDEYRKIQKVYLYKIIFSY